jgi:hypothetical protein
MKVISLECRNGDGGALRAFADVEIEGISIRDSRVYQTIYSGPEIAAWEERNACPVNDKLCEVAVWFFQTMLLGYRKSRQRAYWKT